MDARNLFQETKDMRWQRQTHKILLTLAYDLRPKTREGQAVSTSARAIFQLVKFYKPKEIQVNNWNSLTEISFVKRSDSGQ